MIGKLPLHLFSYHCWTLSSEVYLLSFTFLLDEGQCGRMNPHTILLCSVWESPAGIQTMTPRWLSHSLSHRWRFCHLFQSNSQQLNPLHQIRAPLPISLSFHPFHSPLWIMVNPTSIREAPFTAAIPRGGLITLGCFVCLLDGQRSWIEQQAGVD